MKWIRIHLNRVIGLTGYRGSVRAFLLSCCQKLRFWESKRSHGSEWFFQGWFSLKVLIFIFVYLCVFLHLCLKFNADNTWIVFVFSEANFGWDGLWFYCQGLLIFQLFLFLFFCFGLKIFSEFLDDFDFGIRLLTLMRRRFGRTSLKSWLWL